ncbi:MAG TPA: proteobacterial dedicated sortase system histidine kinase [Gammaproteobacteria bacterium]
MKLRNQLIILSLLTLTLPWAGCEYIREMENTLREGQAQSLLNTTRTIAQITAFENETYFQQHDNKLNTPADNNIYAFTLNSEISLDGYVDDWGQLAEELRYFNNQIETGAQNNVAVALIAATYKSYLYLFIQVLDDSVIYHYPSSKLINGDHLRLYIGKNEQQPDQYFIQTSAPGKIIAEYIQQKTNGESMLRKKSAIYGQWQDTTEGYNIELRIPLKLITGTIGFAIVDHDNNEQEEPVGWHGTLNKLNPENVGHLIQPSDQVATLLAKFKQDNARLRITDSQGWLLANTEMNATELTNISDIKLNETLQAILYQLYRFIMYWSESSNQNIRLEHGRLSGQLIENALHDQAATSWHKPETSNHAIVSASHPIKIQDKIVGIVNAEQTSDAILSITNHALNRLITLSSIAIFVSVVVLLGYATLLSFRIKHLRNATENFISNDGKISDDFKASVINDELGDLSRSFAVMHTRLNEYTQYLQTLASKLSHELRTPLAVIQSSLDNLTPADLTDHSTTYINRAKQGTEQLGKIITAMSEASRVEQALQASDKSRFDLSVILQSSIGAYSDVYKTHRFKYTHSQIPCMINGSPELIVQMLDKLVDNAVDFSPEESKISIHLDHTDKSIMLTVSNQGPTLPPNMQTQLFDSMVSLRDQKSDKPHLGLGLHIVKLIAQAHGGKVRAENSIDNRGVNFIVTLPASQ